MLFYNLIKHLPSLQHKSTCISSCTKGRNSLLLLKRDHFQNPCTILASPISTVPVLKYPRTTETHFGIIVASSAFQLFLAISSQVEVLWIIQWHTLQSCKQQSLSNLLQTSSVTLSLKYRLYFYPPYSYTLFSYQFRVVPCTHTCIRLFLQLSSFKP